MHNSTIADELTAEFLEAESTARAYIELHERRIDELSNDLDDPEARQFVEFLERRRRELVKDYERRFGRYPERGPV